jgi:hypothetical protein
MKLPVLLRSSSCTHAVITTPADFLGVFFAPSPENGSLPHVEGGRLRIGYFGACTMFTFVTACVLAESPMVILLHQRASPNRASFLDCSDCYWLERKLPGGVRTH